MISEELSFKYLVENKDEYNNLEKKMKELYMAYKIEGQGKFIVEPAGYKKASIYPYKEGAKITMISVKEDNARIISSNPDSAWLEFKHFWYNFHYKKQSDN